MVDLAGSERAGDDGTVLRSKEKLTELTSINNSLLILGQCIAALADTKRGHIPYRRSKLTRILKDSLEGDSKVLLVACISPSASCAAETMATLQFAGKAMRVKLAPRKPSTNPGEIKGSLERLREAYEKERRARIQLESYISANNTTELRAELEAAKKENLDLSMKVQKMEANVSGRGRSANSRLEAKTAVEKKRHVRFRSRAENEEVLDPEQRERMEHNLQYTDDTIFENMSIFKDTQEPKPFEQLFHEPVNLNAGYLGDRLETDSSTEEYRPKGKFALLNNSLTLQHERIQSQHASVATLAKTVDRRQNPEQSEENKAFSKTQPRAVAMNAEESAIAPGGDDSSRSSVKAYESLKNDLDRMVATQQQSSMNCPDDSFSSSSRQQRDKESGKVGELYQRILAELSSIKRNVLPCQRPPSAKESVGMFEELRKEIDSMNKGKDTGRAMDIVNQMQRIFVQVREVNHAMQPGPMKKAPKKRPCTPILSSSAPRTPTTRTNVSPTGTRTSRARKSATKVTCCFCWEEDERGTQPVMM